MKTENEDLIVKAIDGAEEVPDPVAVTAGRKAASFGREVQSRQDRLPR